MPPKESTVFVVDLGPSMASANGPTTDLELGLRYLYDIVLTKVLKQRKTDFVSVVACHSTITENPFAAKEGFLNIHVVADSVVPTYSTLKSIHENLTPNGQSVDEKSEGDVFKGILVALALLKPLGTSNNVLRNIIIITNGQSSVFSFEGKFAEGAANAITELKISVLLNAVGFNSPQTKEIEETRSKWILTVENYPNGKVVDALDAYKATRFSPPIKKTIPIRQFRAHLLFGSLPSIENYTETPNDALSFEIETFPAVKQDTGNLTANEYLIDKQNGPQKLKRERTSYIYATKEVPQDIEEEVSDHPNTSERVLVEQGEWTDGFKFSNFDLIAVEHELAEAAKLKTSPSINIIGFLFTERLPYAYLIGEALYLIPQKDGGLRNLLGFNTFVQTLIDLKACALVRFVKKIDDEAQMGILMPTRIILDGSFIYTFILTRLPFKEDEKIGRFPQLTYIREQEDEKTEKRSKKMRPPTEGINDLMEQFIIAKSLDESTKKTFSDITNMKSSLETNDTVSYPLPGNTSDSKLNVSSPAIDKLSTVLKKIIIKSLESTSVSAFLANDSFVKDNLVEKDSEYTNFFNLSNILQVNSRDQSNWLSVMNKGARPIASKLIDAIDIEYIKKEDFKKLKRKNKENDGFNKRGDYGADAGEYGEVPDIL